MRLVLSLFAASSVLVLSACGQGGSAFNTGTASTISRVQLTSTGTPPGVLKVVPGGTIILSATGTQGSNDVIVSGNQNYTFNAAIAPAGTQYQNNVSGQTGSCIQNFVYQPPTPATVPPATPAPAAAPVSFVPLIPASALETNAQAPNTVAFTAPTIASLNATFPVAAGNVAGPAPASYCVFINATHAGDGVVGSAVVYVSVNP